MESSKKNSIRVFCSRYRAVFAAAGYLAVLVLAVMYLRVTISVPPEGDDKLTLNQWMFEFEQMPFWQYLLQDLRWRLDFFTLKEFRFFPFHYPSAFSLLFFGTLASYRLYIIGVTALAAGLVSRVVKKITQSECVALGAFALSLSLAPLYNEGMYSYYAVPQKALAWAAASWLCLYRWDNRDDKHRKAFGVLAGLFAFAACGTYEIGYALVAAVLVLWLLQTRSIKKTVYGIAPVLGGTVAAFVFHTAAQAANAAAVYSGNSLSSDMSQAPRVLVQQMAASIPFLAPLLQGQSTGVITRGDMLWPGLLGLVAALCLCFVPKKIPAKSCGVAAVLGLLLWALPASLLAVSQRYQQPDAITWKWGYIPAAASSVGLAVLVAALVLLLAGALQKLPRLPSVLLRLALAAALAAALCANGAFTRACLREHHALNLSNFEFFKTTVELGLADEVDAEDMIISNENVWAGNEEAEGLFFSRYAGRQLYAQCYGASVPPADLAGDFYAYQTYRNYGGFDLAWCGKAQDASVQLMDGMRVYVQGAQVPDTAVLKYKVRNPDSGEVEERSVSLLDLDKTARDERGDYIVMVYEPNILNSKVMIWPG